MNPVRYALIYIFLNIKSFDIAAAEYNRKCNDWDCKPLRRCPELFNLLNDKRPTGQDIQLLQSRICGFNGKFPRVCCPSPPRPVPSQTQRPLDNIRVPSISTVDVKFHPGVRLLPQSCGLLGDDNKIIMGDAAALYEFPWMALLGYTSVRGFDFRCGGTLINTRYVLTAAHCLKLDKYNLVTVRLGEYDLSKPIDCEDTCAPPVQDIGVEEVIPHPQYSTKTLKRDIGLVRLSAYVTINRAVMPICLPIGSDEQSKELTNEKVTVTGWGKTEYSRMSPILLKADLPIMPRDQCAAAYRANTTPKDIDVTQLCAGTGKGKDSCQGDSGGPMQALSVKNEETVYVQYGLVSYGPATCGNSTLPGVYTRIGFYMPWILDTMRP